ncbi:uncharacterized protein L969DRAFT_48947 [Mixia osmundae IAM 14324]|uniref:GDP/GTP exchange factor Sec2 N-terminal domain-containing protein n=1 Tax=Mixia osmundae (strain CBS 9802 / IAM 14324 / JCM 22182 / KY 12970) TaxID=764103 RepID=G7DZR1_MIXOS|nr:uncharacterized protein L969DRAFT_48947 [Mixia osmundae IAM 14324]KEI39270.1 hypothetical protein L969DRAFT_48947 [Mixia osmundae IAM 14324]GAA96071.1 hypothetical protein E5Q_02732 [Mixia osmundae IAM 14324]
MAEQGVAADISAPSGVSTGVAAGRDTASTTRSDATDPHSVLVATLRLQIADLHSQVSGLNSKLVQSYDRLGNLEDELHHHTEQNVALRTRAEKLEEERRSFEERMEGGVLVERREIQTELTRMMDKLLEEAAHRGKAEADKATIESELDELSATLFSEANQMVAMERITRANAVAKAVSLETSLRDTEAMMVSQAEQLRNLSTQFEEADAERKLLAEQLAAAAIGGAVVSGSVAALASTSNHQLDSQKGTRDVKQNPVYPNAIYSNSKGALMSSSEALRSANNLHSAPSSPYTSAMLGFSLSHPLPLLYTDVLPYTEFISFVRYLRQVRRQALARPPSHPSSESRISSGTFGSIYSSTKHDSSAAPPVLGPVLKGATQEQSNALYQQLPVSTHTSQAFLKRCIEEDTDPALRLDLAPALNFLSRRTINASIIEGTVNIEPAHRTIPSDRCALCGAALIQKFGGGHIRVASSAEEAASGSGSRPTVRKMLNSSWSFGRPSTLSGETASTPASPTIGHGFDHNSPSGAHLSIHVFKAGDNSTTKYPLCPHYCLPRLRAVCDFWTFIRSLERALLLNEGVARPYYDAPAESAPAPRSTLDTPGSRVAESGLGLSPLHIDRSQSAPPATQPDEPRAVKTPPQTEEPTEPADTSADITTNGLGDTSTEMPITGHVVEQGAKAAHADEPAAMPTLETSEKNSPSSASSVTEGFEDASDAHSAEPEVAPAVRASLVVEDSKGLSASPDATPMSTTVQLPEQAKETPQPPPLPPRDIISTKPASPALPPRSRPPPQPISTAMSGASEQPQAMTQSEWEEKWWSEIVKLKETMFWYRVGAAFSFA